MMKYNDRHILRNITSHKLKQTDRETHPSIYQHITQPTKKRINSKTSYIEVSPPAFVNDYKDAKSDSGFQWEIYDVTMKFAHKLIHGGPVHPCYEPL